MNIINQLQLSYPDFQLNTIIDPEQIDTNNLELVTKINQMITMLNNLKGSDVPLVSISDLDGINVQAVLESLKQYVDTHKNNTNNPHNVTATQLDVYTKDELAPFLRGGDTIIRSEVFTIISSDNGDGTFTYSDNGNTTFSGSLTSNGYQVFNLTQGTYLTGQNRIKCIINDSLQRSASNGGLVENSPTTVTLTTPQVNGVKIVFEYFEKVGITGTGLIVISEQAPPNNFIWFKVIS